MRYGGGGGLINQPAGAEPVQREGRVDWVGFVAGDGMGEDMG